MSDASRKSCSKPLRRWSPCLRKCSGRQSDGNRLLEQIFRPYQISASALHQLHNRLLGPLQALGEMDAKEERLCRLLAQRGWVISPSLPYIATQELLRIHDEDGIEALEATLIAHFDGDRLAENLDRCYDRPSFERRRHLFEQALTAHRRGDYGLSVPVWLSQTDGIVFEELQIDKVFSKNKRRYQRLQTELGGEEEFRDHLLNGLLAVLEALGDSVSNLVTPEQVSAELRRHRILHGLDLEYGTERNSIQGVLILELFHMYFDARDGRTTNPTYGGAWPVGAVGRLRCRYPARSSAPSQTRQSSRASRPQTEADDESGVCARTVHEGGQVAQPLRCGDGDARGGDVVASRRARLPRPLGGSQVREVGAGSAALARPA